MDNKINHGGRVFACAAIDPANPDEEVIFQKGMTLRQHYAGQVLIGLAVNIRPVWNFTQSEINEGEDNKHYKEVAETAHKLADAMIKESYKTQERIEA